MNWQAAWRIARRELSARFKGLRLLLACLFLGVGALAAIGSLTTAISQGLADKGRVILGGDVQITVWQRPFTAPERAALVPYGTLSDGLRLQAMASSGDASAPVQLKAVDASWPLVGRLMLADGRSVGAPPAGSAWIASGAAARLDLKAGDSFTIAGKPLRVGGIITAEPDGLGEGFALGPTVIVPLDFPTQAGLTSEGAMFRSRLRLACTASCDAQGLADTLKSRFPEAGLDIRTRDKAAPGAEQFLSRMGDFLVLVGLSALLIAGIGIGGGTASYLEARRGAIATLKVMGATSGDIARIYVLQIAATAAVGAGAGLVAGVAALPLIARALAGVLPVADGFVLAPWALTRAALWGVLVALVFAAPPLAAARSFPAMALLRSAVAPLSARGAWRWVAGGLAGIVALAFLGGSNALTTAIFLGGAGGVLLVLAGLGWLVRRVAMRMPRPKNPVARLALANLHRPGSQTARLVTALGFGLSAFVTLAVVQTSLDANIRARVPQKAPDYFVIDLQPAQEADFRRVALAAAPAAQIRTVPTLRGAILSYGPEGAQTRVSGMKDIPEDAWQLRGERGLTFAADLPEGNALTAGAWWPRDYAGEPLVSVDEKLAKAVGLHVGDRLTIGLLGTERTARIASLRRIDWDTFGFNYVLVFSPNALAGAPFKLAATVSLPDKRGVQRVGPPAEGGLLRALTRAFPTASVIEVGPLLRDARGLLGQMGAAILAAASVAVLAGIAVLLGALAAARAARAYDNTILKVLGASARQLLGLMLAETGMLGALLALVSLALGSLLGWLVVVQLFHFDFLPDWPRVLAVLGGGLVLVLGFALGGSWSLLKTRPAEALREL